jgi:hypothetical protein
MDAFDAQLAAVDQLFDEGHTDDGLRTAVQICRHAGPQQESANMRDARADLLCKVIMYKILHGAQADVLSLPESALLDQKIYSWKYGRTTEGKLFPGLQTTFDSHDAEILTLAKYIQKVKDRASSKHLKWLYQADKDVAIEIFSRMQTLSEPLRIGARVVVSGLKKAIHLNGKKVTITRKQGLRWGVIFDECLNGKAVRPINLMVDEGPVEYNVRTITLLLKACEALMNDGAVLRPDIHGRIAMAMQGVVKGIKCGAQDASPKSGGPHAQFIKSAKQGLKCCGDGRVDFDTMAAEVDNVLCLKEWLLSGLCLACQKHIFHDTCISGG